MRESADRMFDAEAINPAFAEYLAGWLANAIAPSSNLNMGEFFSQEIRAALAEWQLQQAERQEGEVCECELDYNCHLHRNRMYTAIERINDQHSEPEPF